MMEMQVKAPRCSMGPSERDFGQMRLLDGEDVALNLLGSQLRSLAVLVPCCHIPGAYEEGCTSRG